MTVQLIQHPKDFFPYKKLWDTIVENNEHIGVFLTSSWILNWWEQFYETYPVIFPLIFDKSDLVGGFPVFLNKEHSTLEFLAKPVCDYANDFDVVAKKGKELEVIHKCIYFIKSKVSSNLIFKLDMLHENSFLAKYFKEKSSLIYPNHRRYFKRYPKLNLKNDLANSTEHLSSKFKKRLNYYLRKLNSDVGLPCIEWITPHSDDKELLEILFELHKLRWDQKSKKETYFISKESAHFHRYLFNYFCEKKIIRFCTLKIQEKIIGMLYGFDFKNKFYFIQHGIDPDFSQYSIGHLLIKESISQSVNSKKKVFDFLKGRQEYKLKWSNYIDTYYTYYWPISFLGSIKVYNLRLKFLLKNALLFYNDK